MSLISLVHHSILRPCMSMLFTILQGKSQAEPGLFTSCLILQIQPHNYPGTRWPDFLPARGSHRQSQAQDSL